MSRNRQPAKRITVQIDGTVIAAFLLSDDAIFFARAARDAGMFSITNPGSEPVVYDERGNMIAVDGDTYRSM